MSPARVIAPTPIRLRTFAAADGTGVATARLILPRPPLDRPGVIQRVQASTAQVLGSTVLLDSFTTAVASGWGTPDTGPAFSVFGTNIFSVTVGIGRMGNPAGVSCAVLSQVAMGDGNIFAVYQTAPAIALADAFRLYARATDQNNAYGLLVHQDATPQVISIDLIKRVAGVESVLASSAALTLPPPVNLRLTLLGTTISGTAWKGVEPGPSAQAVDASITAAGSVGAGRLLASATNTDLDNMQATSTSVAPTWDAYLGPVGQSVDPPNLVDSSAPNTQNRWIPTLATGQQFFATQELGIVARGLPQGAQIVVAGTFIV